MGLFSSTPTEQIICPICEKSVKESKTKPLYGVTVCKKCLYKLANRRQIAWILDEFALLFAAMIVFGALGFIFPATTSEPGFEGLLDNPWVYHSLRWLVFPLIFCFKDGFSGMSPGKRLMGVQAVDQTTREPIGFIKSFKRNLITMIPIVPLIVALQLNKGYRWGDKWANTAVIWRKYRYKLPFDPRGLLCMGCGYNLTGNQSGRCPECGLNIPVKPPSPAIGPVPIPAM